MTEPGVSEGGATYRVDSYLPQPWPDSVVFSLDNWTQGCLLAEVPVFWHGPSGHDPVLGLDGPEKPLPVLAGSRLSVDWAIVTSQTCDIAGTGPGSRHPYVQVSPLLRVPDEWQGNKLDAIRAYSVTYLAPVYPPSLDGDWVADLRLSLPISKGVLAAQLPTPAFLDEAQRLFFGEHVSARLRRPALHDVFTGEFIPSLGAYIESTAKSSPEWWQHVEQLRLLLTGNRLNPTAAQLIIVEQIALDSDEKQLWRAWHRTGKRILKPYRIALSAHVFGGLDKLPARLYSDSVPLYVPELGRPRPLN